PVQVPGKEWHGVENPGLAQISSGEVLLNQWQYRWLPIDEGKGLNDAAFERCYWFDPARKRWVPIRGESDLDRHPFPYLRADDGAFVHISDDGGVTWSYSVQIDIAPYLGAFSPKGAIELADGTVVLALGSQDHDPLAANFVVRSEDRGRSWGKPIEAARFPGLVFSEPSVAATSSGRLLLISREESTGFIHQSDSDDSGFTWSAPRRLSLWGYPAHCIRLGDGRMLMVYGHRRSPYGIRSAVSSDEGETWGEELLIRDDLAGSDNGLNLGYPAVIEYEPGKLFTVYYGEHDGAICIEGSWFEA
ncbi:MAG: exo-alpha-sialidase, partial [bacterium]